MDAVVEKMATEYDRVSKAGQQQISTRWHYLQASTRKALRETGWYSERGERLQVEEQRYGREPKDDVEGLECAVGRFKLCAGAKLPARKDKGAEIPTEALTD